MNNIRIPRPYQATQVIQRIKELPKGKQKRKLILTFQKNILQQWIIHTQLNNKVYTKENIKKYLGLSEAEFNKLSSDIFRENVETYDLKMLQGVARATYLKLLGGAQGNTERALRHQAAMEASQDRHPITGEYQYTPWVSAEVTKSFDVVGKAIKGELEVLKGMVPDPHKLDEMVMAQEVDVTQDGEEIATTINVLQMVEEKERQAEAENKQLMGADNDKENRLLAFKEKYLSSDDIPSVVTKTHTEKDGHTRDLTMMPDEDHGDRREKQEGWEDAEEID